MKKIQKASALSEDVIRNVISTYGEIVGENRRSLFTNCPRCNRSDKFAVLKVNGACVCYRSSCDFGRQWLDKWLSIVANISISSAREIIYGRRQSHVNEQIEVNFKDDLFDDNTKDSLSLDPIQWPDLGLFPIDHTMSSDAALYLQNRGVDIEIAKKHGFMYNIITRRVIMPTIIEGTCYGWQGRAIDKVESKDRMRNNIGFRRDSLVMFYDTIVSAPYFVIAEGPFDAIKFHLAKHFVATLGKFVSDKQFELLAKTSATKIFLGLDEDAAQETAELAKDFIALGKKVYIMSVPESAKTRCEKMNKKADFGECTPEECLIAMQQAKQYNNMQMHVHLRDLNGR